MSEQTEEEYLIERLSKLLAEISVIVNGPQPMGVLWSYADLPQKVQALKDAAPQPQASAEDVALVGLAIKEHAARYPGCETENAWQRIRASLGVGK
ncbi:MAG: hypothetical protein ACK5PF_09595 [bacterium]